MNTPEHEPPDAMIRIQTLDGEEVPSQEVALCLTALESSMESLRDATAAGLPHAEIAREGKACIGKVG